MKVLRRDGRQRQIVGCVPGLTSSGRVRWATTGLGFGEVALAAWVLSGRRPRSAAAVQAVVLVAMNAGGLWFARSRIPRPGRMLARNAGFLALIWSLA